MPVKSYGYAIGNLRARENSLLGKNDLTRLASLKTPEELAAALRDKGYGSRTATQTVPQRLKASEEALWSYLFEIAPEDSVFKPFLIKNDFHNLKAELKALVRDISAEELLLYPSLCEPQRTETAVKEKNFGLLPENMRSAAEQAYAALVSGADPRLCDAIIDRHCADAQLTLVRSKDYRCPLGREIIENSVLLDNIKAALRCAKTRMSAAFTGETLADTEYPSASRLKAAALAGEEHLLSFLESCGGLSASAAAAWRISPAEFEKFADNSLTSAARKAKLVTLGSEPVLGYYMAREAEFKNLRIIYCGIKCGDPPERIAERLRELYD